MLFAWPAIPHSSALCHCRITCCTKWAPKDRHTTSYREWSFEYDHVFVSGDGLTTSTSPAASLIPYDYPGTRTPCADAACTGENPPSNVTALHQGSWHRGWLTELVLLKEKQGEGLLRLLRSSRSPYWVPALP